MHVVECADYGGPYSGSFVPMLRATAEEAARRGHHTTIVLTEVARDRAWLAELDGLASIHFAASGTRTADAGAMARELAIIAAARPGPAILHTHFASFDIPAALATLWRRNTYAYWHEHGPLRADPRTRLRNTARYLALGAAVSGILCVSDEVLTELRNRRAPAKKLHEFSNAVDPARFRPISASERRNARDRLGLPEGRRAVLHFGWSWERKGGPLLMQAARLLGDDPQLRILTVLGEGRDEISLIDGVDGVLALAPTADVTGLYAAVDAFVSCSAAEGMPLAVLEALACGLPVLGTHLPVQDRLLAGLPGAVVVDAEPAALARGLQQVAALPELIRVEHARRASAMIERRFSLPTWARRLLDLFERHARATG